jgi:hypothetical protein
MSRGVMKSNYRPFMLMATLAAGCPERTGLTLPPNRSRNPAALTQEGLARPAC